MKTTNKTIAGAALLASLLAAGSFATPASAAPGGPGGPGRMGAPIRGALEYAGVTDEQKERARVLGAAARSSFAGLAAQARANREALRALAAAPSPDPKEVGLAFLKADADRKAMKALRDKVEADVRALLTPEQRARFDAILEGARRGGPAGGAGQRRMGPGQAQ